MGKILDSIKSPADLKKLEMEQLSQLSREIRKYLVEVVSEGGGHLSSNLGVVELTIALHYCFQTPIDKIVWDVGHQSYVHKILTGRKEALRSIRKLDGLSGFPKRSESEHDSFDTGHSSTSISAALGFAMAKDILGHDNYVVSVIGDGALTGGMAFEAMNNVAGIKKNFIVILNDNQMSISKNVGGISLYLDEIRTTTIYHDVKEDVQKFLRKIPKVGEGMIHAMRDMKDSVKQLFIPGMFFEEMGFTYLGPIDGHNIRQVITTLNQAKKVNGPVFIHVNTVKGKGYKFAEEFPTRFHSVKQFEKESGNEISTSNHKSYSTIFGETLIELAKDDPRIVAITAAMPEGTGLEKFAKAFPNRFFDVGIAEQHALTFSAGLACSGFKPFFAVYSSFLQRGYDQLVHDIALQKLPVVIGIDRSGIVGEDGETHQGIFDTSFLNHIPNLTIMAPKNGQELREMMFFASTFENGPICIKYPRGNDGLISELHNTISLGEMEVTKKGDQLAILSVGTLFDTALVVQKELEAQGVNPTIVNVRFIKPLNKNKLRELAETHTHLVVIEESILAGGYGSEVVRELYTCPNKPKILLCGIEDQFIRHGSRTQLLDLCNLSAEKLIQRISAFLKDEKV